MLKVSDRETGKNRSVSHLASSSDYKRPICERLAALADNDPLQIIDNAIEKALDDPTTQEPFSRDDYLDYALGGRKRFSQGTHPLPRH